MESSAAAPKYLPRLSTDEVGDLLQVVRARVLAHLVRRGIIEPGSELTVLDDGRANSARGGQGELSVPRAEPAGFAGCAASQGLGTLRGFPSQRSAGAAALPGRAQSSPAAGASSSGRRATVVRVPLPPPRRLIGKRVVEGACRPVSAHQLGNQIPDLARAHAHLAGGQALDLLGIKRLVHRLVDGHGHLGLA